MKTDFCLSFFSLPNKSSQRQKKNEYIMQRNRIEMVEKLGTVKKITLLWRSKMTN